MQPLQTDFHRNFCGNKIATCWKWHWEAQLDRSETLKLWAEGTAAICFKAFLKMWFREPREHWGNWWFKKDLIKSEWWKCICQGGMYSCCSCHESRSRRRLQCHCAPIGHFIRYALLLCRPNRWFLSLVWPLTPDIDRAFSSTQHKRPPLDVFSPFGDVCGEKKPDIAF